MRTRHRSRSRLSVRTTTEVDAGTKAYFMNQMQDCKSGRSCKRQKWQKLQTLQKVANVQNKAKDCKQIAYKASRTPFSRFGNKD